MPTPTDKNSQARADSLVGGEEARSVDPSEATGEKGGAARVALPESSRLELEEALASARSVKEILATPAPAIKHDYSIQKKQFFLPRRQILFPRGGGKCVCFTCGRLATVAKNKISCETCRTTNPARRELKIDQRIKRGDETGIGTRWSGIPKAPSWNADAWGSYFGGELELEDRQRHSWGPSRRYCDNHRKVARRLTDVLLLLSGKLPNQSHGAFSGVGGEDRQVSEVKIREPKSPLITPCPRCGSSSAPEGNDHACFPVFSVAELKRVCSGPDAMPSSPGRYRRISLGTLEAAEDERGFRWLFRADLFSDPYGAVEWTYWLRQNRINVKHLDELLARRFWVEVIARAQTIGPVDWSAPEHVTRTRERGKHFRARENEARAASILCELQAGHLTHKEIADLYDRSESYVQKLNNQRKRMLLQDEKLTNIEHRLDEVVSILLTLAGDPVAEAENALGMEDGDYFTGGPPDFPADSERT